MSDNVLEGLSWTSLESLDSRIRTSRDGYSFNVDSDKWILNKDVTISYQRDVLSIEPETLEGFKSALARYAEEASAKHTLNMYHRFQRMIRDTGCDKISVHVIRNWRGMLDDSNEWYLGALRGFLISWHDFGYYGVDSKVVTVLERMRLSGNEKGVAISNRCPYSGALTQHEQVEVANELIRLFSRNKISLSCYSYLVTLQATARRSVQLRQLKSIDLSKEYCVKSKANNFYLNIPRAKQRGGGFRKEFKKLAITEEIYLTLLNLIAKEQENLRKIIGCELTDSQKKQTPIFFDIDTARKMLDGNGGSDLLDEILATEVLHLSTNQLRNGYMHQVNKLNQSVSERTGDIIHLTARRFRRTRGTNLGRKGVSAFIIAEILDHSDKQNAMVYMENTVESATYIDKAVGKELAPFARAFKGQIIACLSDGERGDDLSARIPGKDNEVVGACGTNDFCIKGYEACYLCEKFRPLLDAEHEKFLEGLYAEKDARLKATKSEQYASTKDTLILAVEWVVQACKKMKAERGIKE